MASPHDASRPVAFDGAETYSWKHFSESVAKLTEELAELPETKFAICAQNSYQFAIAFMACAHSQKHIILPGNYQPAALNELSAQFDGLLHDDAVEAISGKLNIDLALELKKRGAAQPSLHQNLNLDALSLTLFTSGSSGTPKAIHKSLRQIDTELVQLEQQWGDALSSCRMHSTVSQQHIYGLLFRLLWPLCTQRPFSCQNIEFPEQVMNVAAQDSVLISSPALLKRMSTDFSSKPMRMVFSSGGPLSFDSAQLAHSLFGTYPVEVFGSTETGGIAFRQQHSSQSPWTLFSCIQAKLNSENCLGLKSPFIDINHWYQTADECEFINDTQFILKGRTDRVIKIEEKRISLVEVEKRLEQLAWISECVVLPFEQGQRLTLASALVLSEAGQEKVAQIGKGKFWLLLRSELRQWLEPIAIPRRYRVCGEIPLNSQGKRLISDIEKLLSV